MNKKLILGGAAGLLLAQSLRVKWIQSQFNFQDRVVLLSGGSRGLGLVIARQLVGKGARVAVLARDFEKLQEAAKEFSEDEFFAVSCDVGKSTEVRRAVTEVTQHFGGIDIVIHNAGLIQVGSFENMGSGDYRTSIETHFWGAYHLITETLSHLKKSDDPRVLLINSIGGKFGVPHLAPYCAGKFAMSGFAQAIEPELRSMGVSLTVAYPGLMRTGSPYNAGFKGHSREERFWFTLFDSLPVVTISAERAASQVIAALASGRAEVYPGAVGFLGVKASQIAPGAFRWGMRLMDLVLPRPGRGKSGKLGRELGDDPRLEVGAVLTHFAAAKNNEL